MNAKYQIIFSLILCAQLPLRLSAQTDNPENLTYLHQMIIANASTESIHQRLAGEPVDINAQTTTGLSAMMMAALRGRHDTLALLKGFGAHSHLRDQQGQTALHWAVNGACLQLQVETFPPSANFIQSVRYLEASIPVDSVDSAGRTPLHFATQCGFYDVVESLLDLGAQVNLQDQQGWAALHYATTRAQKPIIELLFARGAEVNLQTRDGKTPLLLTLARIEAEPEDSIIRRSDLVDYLLDHGADVNLSDGSGVTPLIQAADYFGGLMIKRLRERGALPNAVAANGDYAILNSIKVRDITALDIYCEDPEVCFEPREGYFTPNRTPLQALAESDQIPTDYIRSFRKRGAKLNTATAEGTPLHFAAKNSNIEMAKAFVIEGADVNAQNAAGETPLLIACKQSNYYVALELLKFYANPNTPDHSGITPLIAVTANDELGIFWQLMENPRINLNARLEGGDGAIHFLSRKGKVDELKALVSRGADVNLTGQFLRTPIHVAVIEGHLEILRFLVEQAQANYRLLDADSRSPLDLAQEMNRAEIVEYLVSLPQ